VRPKQSFHGHHNHSSTGSSAHNNNNSSGPFAGYGNDTVGPAAYDPNYSATGHATKGQVRREKMDEWRRQMMIEWVEEDRR